jgi:phosphatidylglycerol:prolipoprotein diacylglycerol transferase
MYPTLLEFGPISLPTYGVLVVFALLTGLTMAGRLAARDGFDREKIYNLGIYLALAGIFGSKLALIVQEWDYYRLNPDHLFSFATLQSGGIFYGGFVAAILTTVWYARRSKLSFLRLGDVFSPALALGLSIGRLGCFSAGCCWGETTNVPWAVTFTNLASHANVGIPLNVPLHPTQIYESVLSLAIFLFLYTRKKKFDGQIFGLYLVLGPVARFLVELFRHHSEESFLWGHFISDAQGVSILLFAAGLWVLWLGPYRRRAHLAVSHS